MKIPSFECIIKSSNNISVSTSTHRAHPSLCVCRMSDRVGWYWMLAESWSRPGGQRILLRSLPTFLQQSRLVSIPDPISRLYPIITSMKSFFLPKHRCSSLNCIYLYSTVCGTILVCSHSDYRAHVWIIRGCLLPGTYSISLWEVSDVESCVLGDATQFDMLPGSFCF